MCFQDISAWFSVSLQKLSQGWERWSVYTPCKIFPQVSWTEFPPPVDEGGPFYLEQFFNEFCDNSKQDCYRTASGIKAAIIKLFVQTRSWLDEKRRCFLQSDGVVNYHEPTSEVDLHWIGSRCFSEPGDCKDWIDANSAIVKCIMRRCCNKGVFVNRTLTSTFFQQR